MTKEEKFVIDVLKKDGTFVPESRIYNDALKKMERQGLITVGWPELDEPPFFVMPTSLFNEKKRKGLL